VRRKKQHAGACAQMKINITRKEGSVGTYPTSMYVREEDRNMKEKKAKVR